MPVSKYTFLQILKNSVLGISFAFLWPQFFLFLARFFFSCCEDRRMNQDSSLGILLLSSPNLQQFLSFPRLLIYAHHFTVIFSIDNALWVWGKIFSASESGLRWFFGTKQTQNCKSGKNGTPLEVEWRSGGLCPFFNSFPPTHINYKAPTHPLTFSLFLSSFISSPKKPPTAISSGGPSLTSILFV